jgi:threonyl-tRNA synthetase
LRLAEVLAHGHRAVAIATSRAANCSASNPIKAKIQDAEQLRVHTMLVIGGRDMEAGAMSVRLHHGGPQGAKPKGEVVADILASIKERKA